MKNGIFKQIDGWLERYCKIFLGFWVLIALLVGVEFAIRRDFDATISVLSFSFSCVLTVSTLSFFGVIAFSFFKLRKKSINRFEVNLMPDLIKDVDSLEAAYTRSIKNILMGQPCEQSLDSLEVCKSRIILNLEFIKDASKETEIIEASRKQLEVIACQFDYLIYTAKNAVAYSKSNEDDSDELGPERARYYQSLIDNFECHPDHKELKSHFERLKEGLKHVHLSKSNSP
ncbi:hypothetical protein [Gayadomonas joobiniege]|uniref:hypothetical protein n=1 Tax=Gayadomonas joobiniege TaxID=1234606 RepID=UPI0003822D96|nr:hypothetical protein [Gayadomonas joobiniege]